MTRVKVIRLSTYRIVDLMVTATVIILAAALYVSSHTRVILAVPMPGYGLPVCQTEDATPPGGCVWPAHGATWINYPGRP